MSRILVALRPECSNLIHEILSGHKLTLVHSMEEAQKFLNDFEFELVLCSLLFDDSRMFNLLRLIKASEQYRDVPFICFRASASELSTFAVLIEGTEIAAKALGANAFLDFDSGLTAEDARREIEHWLSQPGKTKPTLSPGRQRQVSK